MCAAASFITFHIHASFVAEEGGCHKRSPLRSPLHLSDRLGGFSQPLLFPAFKERRECLIDLLVIGV